MFCQVCKNYGKPPASACGTWVTKPGYSCDCFSQMKLVKKRLKNLLGDGTLDMLMKISVEGPKTLNIGAAQSAN